MKRISYFVLVAIALTLAAPNVAAGQAPGAPANHVVVVHMVTKNGGASFAFQPSDITAQTGDTVRFVNDAVMPHNIHFKTHPPGARLGDTTVGPYVTSKGQTYDVVLDARFPPGRYEFVCDPHESLGMRGVLTIVARPEPSGIH